jgi:hypothetical protein
MKKILRSVLSAALLVAVPALAGMGDTISPGSYSAAIEITNCDIVTEPTFTKRAICVGAAEIGERLCEMPVRQGALAIQGQGWTPSRYRWDGELLYTGTGSKLGAQIESKFLPIGDDWGTIQNNVYLPGSTKPDVIIYYEIHWW